TPAVPRTPPIGPGGTPRGPPPPPPRRGGGPPRRPPPPPPPPRPPGGGGPRPAVPRTPPIGRGTTPAVPRTPPAHGPAAGVAVASPAGSVRVCLRHHNRQPPPTQTGRPHGSARAASTAA